MAGTTPPLPESYHPKHSVETTTTTTLPHPLTPNFHHLPLHIPKPLEPPCKPYIQNSTAANHPSPTTPSASTTPISHDHSHRSHHHGPPQRVLLLVAVQKAMLEPRPIGVPAADTVGPNIQKILSHARSCSSHHPPLIIHVRNSGDTGDPDETGSPGWELVHDPLPSEPVIDKLKNNAFAATELGNLIREDAEIIVAGLQSDFCIRATCSAALARGNEVLLVRGAHATYDRLEAFHVGHVGTVTPAQTVEKEIEDELEEAGVILLDMKDVSSIFDNR